MLEGFGTFRLAFLNRSFLEAAQRDLLQGGMHPQEVPFRGKFCSSSRRRIPYGWWLCSCVARFWFCRESCPTCCSVMSRGSWADCVTALKRLKRFSPQMKIKQKKQMPISHELDCWSHVSERRGVKWGVHNHGLGHAQAESIALRRGVSLHSKWVQASPWLTPVTCLSDNLICVAWLFIEYIECSRVCNYCYLLM